MEKIFIHGDKKPAVARRDVDDDTRKMKSGKMFKGGISFLLCATGLELRAESIKGAGNLSS